MVGCCWEDSSVLCIGEQRARSTFGNLIVFKTSFLPGSLSQNRLFLFAKTYAFSFLTSSIFFVLSSATLFFIHTYLLHRIFRNFISSQRRWPAMRDIRKKVCVCTRSSHSAFSSGFSRLYAGIAWPPKRGLDRPLNLERKTSHIP